ncbi:hypothetical protein [Alkalicoccobacillus plakortidis]|uniref:Uncharacterized protein n=1 Tax=Alkalicoccobacillus plakortidis TaxID=444060 RepID=A0ABT0XFH1_9BACI|nr:hypothetical protein [Alkalicoccobacillus plakortidis]MCM2674645.1 hypothetical protein [Alkalicoccobacillus plakortidis]
MSKKWTGQEFFLLGAAVCTLCLMYLTILLPGSFGDDQFVDGIEDQKQEQEQFVDSEYDNGQINGTSNQDYAYKFNSGERTNGADNE